ncbi:hypothetical protein NW752_012145 [Fusarium irregulare]|uniref:Carrier domain-containing protein n=1 Tax=Fusarium irregulare TaxID=2494466 RepID=A0A9W8PH22_9HYPO|nr:hypothetical protein NW752_012145 [Fusarium irregulare]KAJ4006514.1 hypothetical protein NW766_010608 [Fusarium irregulare]
MAPKQIVSQQDVDEKVLEEIASACGISVDQIEDVYSCTPLQTAIMAESTIHAGASVFQFVLNLSSELDLDHFCASLNQVVSLNAILRTRLVECSEGLVQVVTNEKHETRRLQDDTDIKQYMIEDEKKPMGHATTLIRTAIIRSQLLLTIHHGIMDHASLTPLFEDVLTIYHGGEANKRADFKEFVSQCSCVDEDEAKSCWSSRFNGPPSIFPKVKPGYLPFGASTITRKVIMAQVGNGVSAAHVPSYIETAWAMTAANYSGSDSVAFGLIFSGRNSTFPAAETTLGPTIAIVPVQVTLSKTSTLEGILKERTSARRQLQQHSSLQYGVPKIRAVSEAARVGLLNIRPRWYDSKESSEISFQEMKEPAEPFALSLSCDLEDDGITIHASTDPKIVPDQQLVRILDQFEHMLLSLTEATLDTKLDTIPSLSPGNLAEIMKWNSTSAPSEERLIDDAFRDRAQKYAKSLAVEAWDGSLTYAELDDLSDRVARQLQVKGATKGTMVAFVFEKSLWTIVAILGILKAGAVSIPISADDPPARKQQVISSAGINVILASTTTYAECAGLASNVAEISASAVKEMPPVDYNNDTGRDPSDLAFVIYTSGSTGLPKGVMLEHRNLSSVFKLFIDRMGYKAGDRTLQFSAHVWDMHLGETFTCLLSGGTLCVPSEEQRKSSLTPFITSNHVDHIWLTPTVIRTLIPEDFTEAKSMISAGEPISPDAATVWGGKLKLYNGWGPCESSVASAVAEVTPDSPYPESIGYPFNGKLWIVNPKNVDELVPIGTVGEIVIDGPGVSRGYLNDESKTKTSFIKPPPWALKANDNAARRLYRTGDLARYNPDGSLCFLGRKDSQVKIRGQRLELGEVENHLSGCAVIREIFVATKIVDGRTQLVAVLTLDNPDLLSEEVLMPVHHQHEGTVRKYLQAIGDYARSKMPSYMVPTIWLVVQRMPRTESAKLDRSAISQWLKDKGRLSSAKKIMDVTVMDSATKPSTDEELLLQSIWAKVLRISQEQIGRESCFVSLGGDSILAMQVASQSLRQGLPITTSELLKNTSLQKVVESRRLEETVGKSLIQPDGSKQSLAKTSQTMLQHLDSLGISRQNVEAIVSATDGQATMLALGEIGEQRGYYIEFELQFREPLDTARLRDACGKVIEHHAILRIVFAFQGSSIFQVVLKDVPLNMMDDGVAEKPKLAFRQGAPLACFHLDLHDNLGCLGLRLEIHHALYDAISLGLVFRDLDAAYSGNILSEGVDFHDWVSHVESLDLEPSQRYWTDMLQGSTMSSLVPTPKGAVRGYALDKKVDVHVPLSSMTISSVTPSTLVKAAWALVLSQALGIDDVVFGEVVANRSLPLAGIETVRGPCVNQVPVRVRVDSSTTMASLVHQIQYLHISSMPHHHLGTRSIIRKCTSWPSWTRFTTALVYQNHASVGDSVTVGGHNCSLSINGELGDSTDIHIIAIPHREKDQLEISLRYSDLVFTVDQVKWLSQRLGQILNMLPSAMEQSLQDFRQAVNESPELSCEFNELPQHPKEQCSSQESNGDATAHVSDKATSIVDHAWETVGLLPGSSEEDPVSSMWDQDADVVTTLLLSEQYRSSESAVSLVDILRNPSKKSQAVLIDRKYYKGSTMDLVTDEFMVDDKKSENHCDQIARRDSGIGS